MPEVGGGPKTSIFEFGKSAAMSRQTRCGLGSIERPFSSGASLASAANNCARVRSKTGASIGLGDDDAVVADFHFENRTDAVLGAQFDFGFFDLARGVRDVGAALAEKVFEAAAGAGRLNIDGVVVGASVALGDDGRKRIHRRRSRDLQCFGGGCRRAADGDDGGGCERGEVDFCESFVCVLFAV